MKDHPLFRHLALSAALALAFHFPLEALAQTPPDQVKITTWGTRTFALGNFTGTKDLGIVAGMTLGSNNLMGMPSSVEVKDQGGNRLSPKRSLVNQHIAHLYQVQAGQVYQGEVRYAPSSYGYKALYVRVRASQGTILNAGKVILTDAPDYQRSSARLVYGEVWANGNIPTWAAILGAVFWMTGFGIPVAAVLWGTRSGSAEYTITFPPGTPGTVTLYYKMTGCTAFSDYNGSFTVPVSSLQPGVAYGVDIYGWCGGGGIGNWARASQRALTPAALNTPPGRLNVSVPGLSGVYVDVVWQAPQVSGPDDCSGTSTSFYSPSGGGIEFKMSGAECWPTKNDGLGVLGFGGPGPTGGVRTTLPSLNFQGTPTPRLYGVADEPLAVGQVSPSSVNITFTPRGYYMGSFYTVSQSGTATAPGGGGSVSGTGVQVMFSPSDPMAGLNVVDNLSSVSLPTFTLTLSAGTGGSCTLTNNNSTSYTLYQLLPPGTYTLNPGGTTTIQAPQYTLGAKGSGSNTLSLPKGFYYIVGQSQLPGGVSVSGCTVAYGYGSAAADAYVSYRTGVFALR